MKYLLDTDICIGLLRGKPQIIEAARKFSPDDLGISSITRYELQVGVAGCPLSRREVERQKVEYLLSCLHEVAFDQTVADQSAQIRAELLSAGTPIGPMDTLIAGTAVQHGWILITGNQKEFSRVKNLKVESWAA